MSVEAVGVANPSLAEYHLAASYSEECRKFSLNIPPIVLQIYKI